MQTNLPSHESKSLNSDSIVLIINHVLVGRSAEVDQILQQMCIYDHHLIAFAAESLFYTTSLGLEGEWDNSQLNLNWEYALPYAVYEYGDSFEKKVLSNSNDIYAYMFDLYRQYQLYLYHAIMHSGQIERIQSLALHGATIYTGNNFSLINIGENNESSFQQYDVAPTFAFSIHPRGRS